MKRAIGFLVVLFIFVECCGIAESSVSNQSFPQEATVGDCLFRITGFSFTDRIGYYQVGRYDVGSASDYYESGSDAKFAVLWADIVNQSGGSVEYTDGCEVKVYEGGTNVYDGWAAQLNYENFAQFGDEYGEDSGKQNKRWVVNPKDSIAVSSGGEGHFLFACNLLNTVVNGTESLNMVITLSGGKKITYQIREDQSSEVVFSSSTNNTTMPVEDITIAPKAEPTTIPPQITQTIPMTTMSKGSKGSDVRVLQNTLIELGYLSGSADGDFGGKTEAAVQAAQSMINMSATGVADSGFLTMLFSGNIPYALGGTAQLSPCVITSSETSHHTEKHGTYPVANVFDGNTSTCWAEGASGYGIGEGISFTIATFGRSSITMKIYSGYHKSSERYRQNGRPKDTTISVDGIPQTHTFSDVMSPEEITIGGLDGRAFVTIGITIDSVYSGSKWSDTCISEIQVY